LIKNVLFAGGLLVASAASAQNMPLHVLVQKGTSLEKKGPLALFSRGEIRTLQSELQEAGKRLRAERLAAKAAGRKPAYCPPEKGEPMGAQKLLAELRSVSATLPRTATVTDGMRVMLARKYPCPA
jgi:hypothetical protein